jgi:hypothetical protein
MAVPSVFRITSSISDPLAGKKSCQTSMKMESRQPKRITFQADANFLERKGMKKPNGTKKTNIPEEIDERISGGLR